MYHVWDAHTDNERPEHSETTIDVTQIYFDDKPDAKLVKALEKLAKKHKVNISWDGDTLIAQ